MRLVVIKYLQKLTALIYYYILYMIFIRVGYILAELCIPTETNHCLMAEDESTVYLVY